MIEAIFLYFFVVLIPNLKGLSSVLIGFSIVGLIVSSVIRLLATSENDINNAKILSLIAAGVLACSILFKVFIPNERETVLILQNVMSPEIMQLYINHLNENDKILRHQYGLSPRN